jgi:hypothetical protein
MDSSRNGIGSATRVCFNSVNLRTVSRLPVLARSRQGKYPRSISPSCDLSTRRAPTCRVSEGLSRNTPTTLMRRRPSRVTRSRTFVQWIRTQPVLGARARIIRREVHASQDIRFGAGQQLRRFGPTWAHGSDHFCQLLSSGLMVRLPPLGRRTGGGLALCWPGGKDGPHGRGCHRPVPF